MNFPTLQIVVMAAGQGKRMQSALPKTLHPLAGRPLVAHVIDTVRGLSPKALCVVVGHGGEQVQTTISAPDLTFVTQDPPRGTGDAVRVALAALPDEGVTIVANGDCPLIEADTFRAIATFAAAGRLALLTARVSEPAGLGRIVRDGDGTVLRIVEDRDASPDERVLDEIYTGVLAAPTRLLRGWVNGLKDDNAQREFYLTDVVKLARAAGVAVTAHIAATEDEVQGVNDRAQLAGIERIIQRRQARRLLVAGTTIVDPERFDLRGSLACGRDVRIDVGCVFEGEVRLGDNVTIGPYCVLRNVTVGAGTTIAPFSHLEDAVVGADCRIGPYSRLRPGAALADEVHIGNFVEVKASRVGHGSKANHLAYIGDATIGSGVNVGAGTITANYDGVNKHKTAIGDRASIGSNCVLVAPVNIGAGATIGAGSVISRSAPPDVLTVARSKQTSHPNWKRPVKQPKS